MRIDEALLARHSTRAFLDKPVPRAELEEIFSLAQWSPSNCNVQPWQTYVFSGARKDALTKAFERSFNEGLAHNPDPEYGALPIYEGMLKERQHGSAAALYSAMGIERGDRPARAKASRRNWQFFDAPHVAFFSMDSQLNIMGAVDVGIYAQSLTLVMTERGISSCLQASVAYFPKPIRQEISIPDNHVILFGMSFGYADKSAPVNRCRTERAPLVEATRFID